MDMTTLMPEDTFLQYIMMLLNKGVKTVYVTSVSGPKFYRLDRKQLKEGYVKDGYKSDKISHLVQFFK